MAQFLKFAVPALAALLITSSAYSQDDQDPQDDNGSGSSSNDDPSEGGKYEVIYSKAKGGGGASPGVYLYIPKRSSIAAMYGTNERLKPVVDSPPGALGDCVDAIEQLKLTEFGLIAATELAGKDASAENMNQKVGKFKERERAVELVEKECSELLPDQTENIINTMTN